MNKTLILNSEGNDIYLISNDKISFYINIPNNKDINIAINLVDNTNSINMNNTNAEGIKTEISNIYTRLNTTNASIITPVIDNNILEQIKLNNSEKLFTYIDKVISYLINNTYNILTEENINVNSTIKLINNKTYQTFNNWFITKYNGRVELLDSTIKPNNVFENTIEETPITNEEKNIANEVLEETNTIDVDAIKESGDPKTRELGFVSYVLLGVVVAVISLVILYKLL